MKKMLILAILTSTLVGANAQTVSLTVNFKYTNIVEGYDHQTKTQVFIDGEMLSESETVLESQGAVFTVDVPTGSHDLKVINLALYEGNWEEHLIANEYSIDAIYEESRSFSKSAKLFLLFDVDQGTLVSWKKPVKAKKKK